IDSLNFLIFDNSSNLPLIFLAGVFSKYFQSGKLIPLKTAQTANILQILSLSYGSLTSAISAYRRFHLTISYIVSATNFLSLLPQRLSFFKALATTLSAYSPSLKIAN